MSPDVCEIYDAYPDDVHHRLLQIRALIFSVSKDEALGEIIESLKWGEPSYCSKNGSPIRLDWQQKNPDHVSLFFNCKTSLIETFKEVYKDALQYDGKREIVLPMSKPVPWLELKGCISMALRYHAIKQLPLLGA